MKDNIFHIVINDESLEVDKDYPVFSFFDDLKKPFVQIKNANQFDYLIKTLPDETEVAIWVHPNANLRKEQNYTVTPGAASAVSLHGENIDFNIISRYPDDVSEKLLNQIKKKAIDLNELSDAIKNVTTQTVADIKRSMLAGVHVKPIRKYIPTVDVAIISALYQDEFTSLKEFVEDIEPVEGFKTLHYAKLKDSDKKILIDFQAKMGMVDSTSLSTQIIERFAPKYLIMVGVCGGRATKKVNLLDIIIPDTVFDYMTGKYENGEFKPYLRVSNIENKFIKLHSAGIKEKLKTRCQGALKAKCEHINFHYNSLACGNVVVKTDGFLDGEIAKHDEQVVGVEMESFGVARAAELANNKGTTALIIKSVMDFTEKDKNDNAKEDAAFLSACYTYFLVKDYL